MKLLDLLQPWASTALTDCDITGLQNDSRQIKPGDLFFAYPWAMADGRLFIEAAISQGANAVAYEPKGFSVAKESPIRIPLVPIEHLDKKLAAIASRFYEQPTASLTITGITGTNGKTTIAYQLAQAHSLLGAKAAYIGTLGQGLVDALQPLMNTTPDALCLQQLCYGYKTEGTREVCMEVSSHALSLGRVNEVEFNQAIFTNLSHEHLDFHHTLKAYAEAKSLLFGKPTLQYAIINQDDSHADRMSARLNPSCQKITYGKGNHCDVRFQNEEISLSGTQMDVVSPWGKHSLSINALGTFNIYNSLAVFTSLLAHGYAVTEVHEVMKKLKSAPGRMEVVSEEPYVIVDYAHTPDALENVLLTLSALKRGRLWVVFGCGGDRDKAKRPMMGRVASQYADFIVLTSDNPRTETPSVILDDIAKGLSTSVNIFKLIDREQAIHKALSLASRQDIILIAGKGHETYQQIGLKRKLFSDQAVVQQWYKKGPFS